VELRGGVLVVAQDEFRAGDLPDVNERGERDLAAVAGAHVELIDVVYVCARAAFGFDVGLPLTAEAVEVVDQVATHEGLHSGVDVRERDLLLRGFFAVDIGIELGDGGKVGGDGGGDLLAFGGGAEEGVQIFCKEGRIVVAGAVLKNHGDAAGGPDAGDGGRREAEGDALGAAHQLALHALLDGVELLVV